MQVAVEQEALLTAGLHSERGKPGVSSSLEMLQCECTKDVTSLAVFGMRLDASDPAALYYVADTAVPAGGGTICFTDEDGKPRVVEIKITSDLALVFRSSDDLVRRAEKGRKATGCTCDVAAPPAGAHSSLCDICSYKCLAKVKNLTTGVECTMEEAHLPASYCTSFECARLLLTVLPRMLPPWFVVSSHQPQQPWKAANGGAPLLASRSAPSFPREFKTVCLRTSSWALPVFCGAFGPHVVKGAKSEAPKRCCAVVYLVKPESGASGSSKSHGRAPPFLQLWSPRGGVLQASVPCEHAPIPLPRRRAQGTIALRC